MAHCCHADSDRTLGYCHGVLAPVNQDLITGKGAWQALERVHFALLVFVLGWLPHCLRLRSDRTMACLARQERPKALHESLRLGSEEIMACLARDRLHESLRIRIEETMVKSLVALEIMASTQLVEWVAIL